MILKRAIQIGICTTLFVCCVARKHTLYELPEAMLPHVKEQYAIQCEAGQKLYDINCGGCHNVKQGKRTLIPDFKEEELKGYALRVANARHEESMPDTLVTEEELGIIMTFLRYKKPSGVARQTSSVTTSM